MKIGVAAFLSCIVVLFLRPTRRLVLMLVAFDVDAGAGNDASRSVRKLEQRLRRKQLFLGLLKLGLLAPRPGGVFEAHDIGAGSLELHADPRSLDGDVEGAPPVLVGAELAMLRRRALRQGRNTETEGEQDDHAHWISSPNSSRVSAATTPWAGATHHRRDPRGDWRGCYNVSFCA